MGLGDVVVDALKLLTHDKDVPYLDYIREIAKNPLASAIDAKDKYTNGHSRRVAEYSVKIAKDAGKSEKECERVYFAALLHDVGKIAVPIEILTKKGRLSDS